LAGLILAQLGHLPQVHETASCGEWVFEVLVIEGRRIDKVNAMQADNQAHT
jgi:putative hemolysin